QLRDECVVLRSDFLGELALRQTGCLPTSFEPPPPLAAQFLHYSSADALGIPIHEAQSFLTITEYSMKKRISRSLLSSLLYIRSSPTDSCTSVRAERLRNSRGPLDPSYRHSQIAPFATNRIERLYRQLQIKNRPARQDTGRDFRFIDFIIILAV